MGNQVRLASQDRTSLGYQLARSLAGVVKSVYGVEIRPKEISFEHPKNPDFGDYSSNVLLKFKDQSSNIKTKTLVDEWKKIGLPKEVEKIEVVPPGFLNIWLKNEYLISQMDEVLKKKDNFGKSGILEDKKILLEHTSPNPQTTIMLGHLRNNFLGMTSAFLLESAGATVKLDCIVNDRGIHLCRSMLGYLIYANKKNGLTKADLLGFKSLSDEKIKEIFVPDYIHPLVKWIKTPNDWWVPAELGIKPDHANLIWYVLGSKVYSMKDTDIDAKTVVGMMLIEWEQGKDETGKTLRKLWKTIIGWSEEGYAQTYKRIGSHHDKYWHESDHWREGKDIVEDGLKRGVFKLGNPDPKNGKQPVVTDLSSDGLPDTVVIKSDGTALYMTQDLALTRLKIKEFPSDLYIWDIGSEQSVYFQQLFAVVDKLGIAKKEQLFHLNYALINFKGGGKMATRKGDVVAADETLELLKQRTLEIIAKSNQQNRESLGKKELDDLAEKIAVGAAKYSLLKYSRDATMQFDIDESLSLTGNSGPYLQYTYTRTRSVLRKAKKPSELEGRQQSNKINKEETDLLRTIYKFPEVVVQATQEYAPNLICNYLFDLAQKFNSFYDKHRILTTDDGLQATASGRPKAVDSSQSYFRLTLTAAVGQVVKNGLTLLGIQAPERM